MSTPYRSCAETVRRLHAAAVELECAAELLQLETLAGREWFELLRQKLLPQLDDDAFLVIAVVGGTNIGKSVLFNHLAGCRASATSPLASGTKHPVCLVPPGFDERHDLAAIFEGFQLEEWTSPEAALVERAEHQLFWRTSEQTPENLLVLDTPDIDSDAPVNWQRADHIRRSADVLMAVLTQQKYNDAAVKQFFRQAAAEDKAVIVIFNQCQLPEDDQYWPLWLETFSSETRVDPELVYIAPNDRAAAEENRLPFYERSPKSPGFPKSRGFAPEDEERSLLDDLSRLHFQEIKLRSLRGSLNQLLSRETGAPAYLAEVEQRSGEFQAAAARLSGESVAKIKDWPAVANKLLVDEIRRWWKRKQEGWAKQIHSFYGAVGQGVTWPYRFARRRIAYDQTPPLEVYRNNEWEAILKTVEEVFDKLTWMTESGSRLLRPRLETVLAGKSRSELLERLKKEHQEVQLDVELEQVVAAEMDAFRSSSPELYKFYRQLNNVSAAVRPVTSVVLFTLGWGPAGHVVAPFVADAAAQAVVPIVADLAGGATAAIAGETALAGAAGRGTGFLQAKFQRLQAAFTARRAGWLAGLLKEHLLGTLPEDLQKAADVPQSEAFRRLHEAIHTLQTQLKTQSRMTNDQ